MGSKKQTAKLNDPDIKAQVAEAIMWGIHNKRWFANGRWASADFRGYHPTQKQLEDAYNEGQRLKKIGFKYGPSCPICWGKS